MKEEYSKCRCNNCMNVYEDEELELLFQDDEFFKGCPVCKTDAYLMDIKN